MEIKKTFLIVCILCCMATLAWGTVLGDLAASLKPNSWSVLNTENIGEALGNSGGINGFIFGYTDGGAYDPISEQWLFVGGDHAGPPRFVTYSAKTNAWRIESKPSFLGSGTCHGYDHSAIDPDRGIFYTRLFGGDNIYKYNIASKSWSTVTSGANDACCTGMEYFPEMGGLVYATDGRIRFYDISSGQWSVLASGLPTTAYHQVAEYNPVHKVVIAGGGNASNQLYKVDAKGNVTPIAQPSFSITPAAATLTVDPVSGLFLVLAKDQKLYGYNVRTDQWSVVWNYVPLKMFFTVAFPAYNYGVTVWVSAEKFSTPMVAVYKGAGSSTVVAGPAVAGNGDIGISVKPNPFNGTAYINYELGIRNYEWRKIKTRIYDVSGELIADLTPLIPNSSFLIPNSFSWNASQYPSGIYILKVKIGNRQYSKKLFLQK
jgi:hypothetical protein